MNPPRLHVGVAGLGSIGSRHARLLAARGDVDVTAYDPHGIDDRHRTDTPLGVTIDWSEFLAGGLDAVVIASPDAAHVPQLVDCHRLGLPVLLEKPVAPSLAEATDALAATAGDGVLVGYVLRHHPLLRRAATLVGDGAIGRIASAHLSVSAAETLAVARNRFSEPVPYRLVVDYSHEWDTVRWLLGPVRRCAATATTFDDLADDVACRREHPHAVDALLELESGAAATVHLDYLRSDRGRWATFVGTDGTLTVDVAMATIRLDRGAAPVHEVVATDRDDAFGAQLAHFLDVVRGVPPLVTLADGVAALAVADSVRRASESEGWVDVPAVPRT
ncbi:Gfo/Idh/MocA family protein [Desertimonas flava]|uniref:Gfo/Idh/MocA family protein n=1 Tax=Desertimonas flava TaxID=2064846 RepID=UPI000E344A40|nr:Gfo/Idh/MocA family oxidoreductase [Desertimonas flava]